MLTRIQFDLDSTNLELLNNVMDICGISTRKELFNYALNLAQWVAVKRKEGFIVGSFDEKTGLFKELAPSQNEG